MTQKRKKCLLLLLKLFFQSWFKINKMTLSSWTQAFQDATQLLSDDGRQIK